MQQTPFREKKNGTGQIFLILFALALMVGTASMMASGMGASPISMKD